MEGSRSLFVRSGTRVLLHLERPSGATTLHFELRPIVESLGYYLGIMIRAGVVGGREIVTRTVGFSDLDEPEGGGAGEGGGDATPEQPIQSVELRLAETGSEVLLSIEAPYIERQSLLKVHAIVDQLHFE